MLSGFIHRNPSFRRVPEYELPSNCSTRASLGSTRTRPASATVAGTTSTAPTTTSATLWFSAPNTASATAAMSTVSAIARTDQPLTDLPGRSVTTEEVADMAGLPFRRLQ